jgi:hypothetical protein
MGRASHNIIRLVKPMKIGKSEGAVKSLQVRKRDGKGQFGKP